MKHITMNIPLRLGSSSLIRGWDNHGFLNDAMGLDRGPRNQGDGHDKGHQCPCLAFPHMLNFYVLAIFCILWYISCYKWQNYAFNFPFSCINLEEMF